MGTHAQTASWVGSVVFEYEQPSRRAKAIALLIDICQVRDDILLCFWCALLTFSATATIRLRCG
jgi:hypothetical protein